MTALLQLAGREGLARQQIVKRAILRELVGAGLLPRMELDAVLAKQEVLAQFPHSNLKPVTELRMGREITEGEAAERERREREMEALARLTENNRRIANGLPTLEQEEETQRHVRRRGRRRRTA